MKNQRSRIIRASLACTVFVFLVTALVVYAADPYWMGHLWDAGYAKYKISSSVPVQYRDDVENAAAKWSAPSPFYLQKTTQEPLYVGGHLTFGDPPWWSAAYTTLWYSGSDMRYFVVTFDADLPQGWTDAPCWQVWNSGYRVFSVALHELGHALDFKSVTDDTNTVLYHQYQCYTDLKQRDKNAVDDLY